MKGFSTIFKKEFKRIFTDYRMYLALFLPGLLIFILYSFIGEAVNNTVKNKTYSEITYRVAYNENYGKIEGMENPLLCYAMEGFIEESPTEKENQIVYTPFVENELPSFQQKVKDGEFDLLLFYSEDFEVSLKGESTVKPNLSLYYNGDEEISTHLYQVASSLVPQVYNSYSLNLENGLMVSPNLGKGDAIAQKVLSFVFPCVTISLLFSSIMALCPETIAGEKERGTLTSLLITPTKRSQIVLAKVACLSITSILSGLVSFLGVAFSLPKLMGGLSFSFPPLSILCLFFLIVSALLLFVVIGSLASALAKSVKEATSYLGPCMGILLFMSFLPGMVDLSPIYFSFIPFLNIASSMNMVIASSSINYLFLGFTILSNILYSGLLIYLVAKLFENERIVYAS